MNVNAGNRVLARCYLCGSESVEMLQQLPGHRSATTDGKLLDMHLQKYQCLDCTLMQSDPAVVLNSAIFSYEDTYDFYAKPLMRAFEKERYQYYANWVASFLEQSRPQNVLEVGCGEGWVLELLQESSPSINFQGLEPSAAAARRANDAGLTVQQGDVEDHPFALGRFDFAYCINVLEHVADPIAFLRQLRRLLSPEGVALIICPCANVIDPELLFADHLYSYSRENLQLIAQRSGLDPALWQQGPGMFYALQALYCGRAPAEVPSDDDRAASAWWPDATLLSARRDYFRRWAGLDETLLERLPSSDHVVCFGAGETIDLLRAHAPRSWTAVRELMIDRPKGAAPGAQPRHVQGLQVRFTHDYAGDEFGCILMGVKPRHQRAISDRLQAFGKPVIRWDDVIPEPFV